MERKTKNQLEIDITTSSDSGKRNGLDLIYRRDAIDAFYLQSDDDGWWCGTAQDAEELLKGLSSAEPERKTGKWIRITQGAMPEKYICPFCHREVETYGVEELLPIRYPFCHCGAKMKGEEDE